jgi:hypothetical protein
MVTDESVPIPLLHPTAHKIKRKDSPRFLSINMLRKIGLLTVILIAAAFGADEQTCDAQEIWQKVLAAKGGRDRLHSVSAVHVTERRPASWLYRMEEVWAGPAFAWKWIDFREVRGGVALHVTFGDRHITYATGATALPGQKPYPNDSRADEQDLVAFQVEFLSETSWVQPEMQDCSIQDGEKADIYRRSLGTLDFGRLQSKESDSAAGSRTSLYLLSGRANDTILRYWIDPRTLLPRQVDLRNPNVRIVNGVYETSVQLDDYKAVGGILLPHTAIAHGIVSHYRFELNPRYNPVIFQEPPVGPVHETDWKQKR